jgi:heme exporter protein B
MTVTAPARDAATARSDDAPAPPPRPRHPPPRSRAVLRALLRKELVIELRTREAVPAMALFSVIVFVVFHFALQRDRLEGTLASGVFWVTLLLAAVLGINRLFVAEREQGGFDAFLLAPVDRSLLGVAKVLTLIGYLVVVEVVAVLAFAALLLGPSLGQALPGLLAPLALADVGIAVIGTLVSALAIHTRARELIVSVVGLPLLLPVLIGAARASSPLLAAGGGGGLDAGWLAVLGVYDMVFALLCYAVFDVLLED